VQERHYPSQWTLQHSMRLNAGHEREIRRVIDYLPPRLWQPEYERAALAQGPIVLTGKTPPRWHDDPWLRLRMTELLRQRRWRLHLTLAPDARQAARGVSAVSTICGLVLLRHGWLGRAFCLHMWAPFSQTEPHAAIQAVREQAHRARNLVDLMRLAGARVPRALSQTEAIDPEQDAQAAAVPGTPDQARASPSPNPVP
jgi:hypothetical protein